MDPKRPMTRELAAEETSLAYVAMRELWLDSGVSLDRQDAHRLYMNKRMRISAYHFVLNI